MNQNVFDTIQPVAVTKVYLHFHRGDTNHLDTSDVKRRRENFLGSICLRKIHT